MKKNVKHNFQNILFGSMKLSKLESRENAVTEMQFYAIIQYKRINLP